MDWKDLGASLAKMGLPLLGAALPLPGGAAIGAALASYIGAPDDSKPTDIVRILTDDAATRQRAVEFQASHAETMLRITVDAEQARFATEVDDRKSARSTAVAGGTSGRLFILSLVLLVATLGCEIAVLFFGIPGGVPDIVVGRVLGLMDSVALMVLAFHYGSSAGSARKSELLAQAPHTP